MIGKILFPVELHEQEFSLPALKFAVQQARYNRAELHVLTVLLNMDSPTMMGFAIDDDMLKEIENSASQRLDELVAREVPDSIPVTKVLHKGGTPYDVILRYASENGIDLIVVPSHDKSGLERFLLGSCAAKIVRHAHCSVMVFRENSDRQV